MKRGKHLVERMNDNLYIEEKIEYICKEWIWDGPDATIEDLLGRNLILQEKFRYLRRKKEIHLVRIFEVVE